MSFEDLFCWTTCSVLCFASLRASLPRRQKITIFVLECMYVCLYIYIYVSILIYFHVLLFLGLSIYIFLYTYIHIICYVVLYMHMYTYIYICINRRKNLWALVRRGHLLSQVAAFTSFGAKTTSQSPSQRIRDAV